MRIIRINNCSECDHNDHKGAFGKISYIPVCRATGQELPYELTQNSKGTLFAHATNEIPDWCPLEELKNEDN